MKKLCLITALISSLSCGFAETRLQVSVPVADIRIKLFDEKNPTLEEERQTQILYGERLLSDKEENGWFHVRTVEQLALDEKGKWKNIEGWVLGAYVTEVTTFPAAAISVNGISAKFYPTADAGGGMQEISLGTLLSVRDLSMGWWTVIQPDGSWAYIQEDDVISLTQLHALKETELRDRLCDIALKTVGTAYLPGGRSALSSDLQGHRVGVDAAGLIDLIYRSQGNPVARNVEGQFKQAKALTQEPDKGDLVFLVDPDTKRAVHVMMVLHDDLLIEATGITQNVRTISAHTRLGSALHRIKSGDLSDVSGGYKVYFGSLFSN